MSATIFDSRPLVARMTEELQNEAAQFHKQYHRSPRLAQIIAGHDGFGLWQAIVDFKPAVSSRVVRKFAPMG